MSLLGKLFGNKEDDATQAITGPNDDTATPAAPTAPQLEPAPEMRAGQPAVALDVPAAAAEAQTDPAATQVAPNDGVRAFDQYGREVIVPREEWRTTVLPGMLKEAWDKPDQLYLLILNSLNDGFFAEVTEAAAHLFATDTLPARGACIWGIVLLQAGRLDESQEVLEQFTQTQGEDASVLLNLAKAYAARGDQDRAETTLWRALELEPNLDNGLGWFATIAQERGGDEAATAALKRVAEMPTSWRAQLWLARTALNTADLAGARDLYTEALSRAPRPVPPDFLMQMSGDLGGHGHLAELFDLTGPHFVPEVHGLPVGNNLIKACMDTGDLDSADSIKNALYAFNRPDWKAALAFWDAEIGKARTGDATPGGTASQSIQIGMLRVDGPIWLPPPSPARKLFGFKTAGPSVTFLGGTAEAPQQPTPEQMQLVDALGRMTRALPLFLAEQTELRTATYGRALLPWAVSQQPGQPSGFVIGAATWPDETAVQATSDATNRSDYVVTVHLDAEVEPWTASLAFIRTSDGTRIGELEAEFLPESPETALLKLADEVVDLLSALGPLTKPANYVVPLARPFGFYLGSLEQLLAVRCAAMAGVSVQFLQGARGILDAQLELCLAEPQNVAVRLMLVETLSAMSGIRPEVVAEFRPTFDQLTMDQPLAIVDAVFA